MKNEVLSYTPDAWVDETKTQISYELSSTKYFFHPGQLRNMDEIASNIETIESQMKGTLEGVMQ